MEEARAQLSVISRGFIYTAVFTIQKAIPVCDQEGAYIFLHPPELALRKHREICKGLVFSQHR